MATAACQPLSCSSWLRKLLSVRAAQWPVEESAPPLGCRMEPGLIAERPGSGNSRGLGWWPDTLAGGPAILAGASAPR